MLTKKDYELIAKVIQDCTEWKKFNDGFGVQFQDTIINPSDLYISLGIALEKDNPNFDKYKFWNACKKPFPEEWKKELEQEQE
jgi:hypothetical protein